MEELLIEEKAKRYDKGGWNAPDIVYWLDVELPKELNYEQTKKL